MSILRQIVYLNEFSKTNIVLKNSIKNKKNIYVILEQVFIILESFSQIINTV